MPYRGREPTGGPHPQVGAGPFRNRASLSIALNTARDLLVQAAGVISTAVDLLGTIGGRVLANLMPDRRIRTRPHVVKRAISGAGQGDGAEPGRYNAQGIVDRTSYKATISIDILTTRTPRHQTPTATSRALALARS